MTYTPLFALVLPQLALLPLHFPLNPQCYSFLSHAFVIFHHRFSLTPPETAVEIQRKICSYTYMNVLDCDLITCFPLQAR